MKNCVCFSTHVCWQAVFAFAWLSMGTLNAHAATVWNDLGFTNSWFEAANWDNGIPDATQDITINGASYHAVIDSANADSRNYTLTSGSLTIPAGRTWNVDTTGSSTHGANFTMNIDGGTVTGPQTGSVTTNGTINVRGGGTWNLAFYSYVFGGKVNLGDATTSGTFNPRRITRADSNSTFRGWGTIRHGGWADNYFDGTTIADGWGGNADRELLFQLNGISDSYAWRMQGGGATSTRGYYATNRGYITMPGLPFNTTNLMRGWGSQGEAVATQPTAVNSFVLSFNSITHTGTRNIVGQLLSDDVSFVPYYDLETNGVVTAIYRLTPDAGFSFAGTTSFIHRYDHQLAGSLESELTVFRYDEVSNIWEDLSQLAGYTLLRDLANNRLTLTGFEGAESLTGFFAVGVGMTFFVPPAPNPTA